MNQAEKGTALSRARDIVLICLFGAALLSLLIYFLFFFTPRGSSTMENRTLRQFPMPTVEGVFSGEYQSEFEEAIADQSFFRDRMININNGKEKFVGRLSRSIFTSRAEKGEIVEVYDESAFFVLDGQDYLIQLPQQYDGETDMRITTAASAFSGLSDELSANIIYFVIEPVFLSPANPLNKLYPDSVAGRYTDTLLRAMPDEVEVLTLRYQEIEPLLADFYRTDHHFNGSVAERSYQMIYDSLAKNAPLSPRLSTQVREVPNSLMLGSKARTALYDKIWEPLTHAYADLPEYTVYMDGVKMPRARPERVESGEMRKAADESPEDTRYVSVYAEYFGFDCSRVRYVNESADNDRTLLIVGPSYTQTFEQLLAAHYKNTYIADPRYFMIDHNEVFDLRAYAKEIGADDIVIYSLPQQVEEWFSLMAQ